MTTSQETVQKLALYATVKQRLADPMGVIDMGLNLYRLRKLYRKLREELEEAGVDKRVLDTGGEDLTMLIFETLDRHLRAHTPGPDKGTR